MIQNHPATALIFAYQRIKGLFVPEVLDTTLRDGSYVVDFQFSEQDTYNISKTLESFGIGYIEVGHGLGLGAYRLNEYRSLCSDEEYLSAIGDRESNSKYGVFFIPGIGEIKDIDLAIACNIDFIRIGINVNDTEKSYKYIEYAKARGLKTFANFMKSYAATPKEFARRVKQAYESGADAVYLVDSAGGMLPNDVRSYIQESQSTCDCELGFHGHNNLTLAIANSLTAIECGASFIDTSLQGIGRDGGNASTEVLLSILAKQGLIQVKDLKMLYDYSEVNIMPLIRNKGIKSLPLVSGISFFHSGYYPKIKKYADEYKIDPRDIIVKLSNINIVEPKDEDIIEAIRLILKDKNNKDYGRSFFINMRQSFFPSKDEKHDFSTRKLDVIIGELVSISKKENKNSVFNIVTASTNDEFISNYIQITSLNVIGSCQINSELLLKDVLSYVDGKVDIVLYDGENKLRNSVELRRLVEESLSISKLYLYNDKDLWAKAIENYVLIKRKTHNPAIYVGMESIIGRCLYDNFMNYGFDVFTDIESGNKVDFIIGTRKNELKSSFIGNIHDNTVIIDGGIGSVAKEVIDYCHDKNIEIVRIDMRVVIESEIMQKYETDNFINAIQGRRKVGRHYIVAGGYYGKEGDIVVDSISNPTCVIGIADGKGKVKYSLDDEELNTIKHFENVMRGEGANDE